MGGWQIRLASGLEWGTGKACICPRVGGNIHFSRRSTSKAPHGDGGAGKCSCQKTWHTMRCCLLKACLIHTSPGPGSYSARSHPQRGKTRPPATARLELLRGCPCVTSPLHSPESKGNASCTFASPELVHTSINSPYAHFQLRSAVLNIERSRGRNLDPSRGSVQVPAHEQGLPAH